MTDFRAIAHKLGADRCKRALRAFEHPQCNQESWNSCVLAWAYGEPGELEALVDAATAAAVDLRRDLNRVEHEAAARALNSGITAEEVKATVQAFDDDPDTDRFLALETALREEATSRGS